jgi:hypothetical protein
MEELKISYNEIILYITLANIALGFLFGSFPLICGLKMKNQKYGLFGFIGSIIGGAILGVFLSFPIAVIFTWLILKKSFADKSAEAVNVNENPAKLDAENTEIR